MFCEKIFGFLILTSLYSRFFIVAIYRIIKCSDILAIAYFIENPMLNSALSPLHICFLKNATVFNHFYSDNLLCKCLKYMSLLQKTKETETHRACYYLLCIGRKYL